MKKPMNNLPKSLKQLGIALVGAHVTGALYLILAFVLTGTVAIESSANAVILILSVAFVMTLVLKAQGEDESNLELTEEKV